MFLKELLPYLVLFFDLIRFKKKTFNKTSYT